VRAAAKVGTGFLIARNLILTCNHVLADPGERTDTVLDFFYELDATDRERTPIVARLDPNGIFWTDVSLDATMAQLTEESASALEAENCLPLTRRRTRPRVGDRVSIIQHPLGGLKQVSFQNNFAEFVDDTVLQYTTGTLPGSSGSPVFDTDFRGVVAIHNSGGRLSEPGTSYFYLRNQGTLLEAIARSGGIE
jgi:V8-like Glu-specific endopeptidase